MYGGEHVLFKLPKKSGQRFFFFLAWHTNELVQLNQIKLKNVTSNKGKVTNTSNIYVHTHTHTHTHGDEKAEETALTKHPSVPKVILIPSTNTQHSLRHNGCFGGP